MCGRSSLTWGRVCRLRSPYAGVANIPSGGVRTGGQSLLTDASSTYTKMGVRRAFLRAHALHERRLAVCRAADVRQNGAATSGWCAGGLEYLPGVLSGHAAAGLSLRPPVAHLAGRTAASRLAPGAPLPSLAGAPHRRGRTLAAAHRCLSCPLAVDALVALGGLAVSGGFCHRADAPGLVQPDGEPIQPRSVFSLCRQ